MIYTCNLKKNGHVRASRFSKSPRVLLEGDTHTYIHIAIDLVSCLSFLLICRVSISHKNIA